MLRIANLSLLILFPIAWCAPLLRAGILPLFGMDEISVISGVMSLWQKDIFLTVILVLFAMIAPLAKVIALDAALAGRLPERVKPWLFHLGRLAMADVFLVAIYITLVKGLGVGRIEVAWGLYLFTACVLAALAFSLIASKKTDEPHST